MGFEREVARLFQRWFPKARRGLQYQVGEFCPDVIETPFYIECKRGRTLLWEGRSSCNMRNNLHRQWLYTQFVDKASQWEGDYNYVLIVWKLDRQPIKVLLAFRDWLVMKSQDASGLEWDRLIAVTWKEFAKVLDTIYEPRLEIKIEKI